MGFNHRFNVGLNNLGTRVLHNKSELTTYRTKGLMKECWLILSRKPKYYIAPF